MSDIDNEQFKKLFEYLKKEDAQNVPNFDQMWETARAKQTTKTPTINWKWRLKTAVAATIIGLLGFWVYFQTASSPSKSDTTDLNIALIYEWEASSNVLLNDLMLYDNTMSSLTNNETLLSWEAPSDALFTSYSSNMVQNTNTIRNNQLEKIELN